MDENLLSLSIIVPVYSGEKYLNALTDSVEAVRAQLEEADAPIKLHELILVDDNAIDDSGKLIDQIAQQRPWVVALHLSRNYGQHPATIAGILHSSGDWIVTLDEDLQHPPARIEEMLETAVRQSADLVYGKPQEKVHNSWFRDLGSKSAKTLLNYLSGNPSISKVNSFRLMRGTVARAAASVCSYDTYFDVALSWFTQRVETVEMKLKDERYIQTGNSGYNLKSLLSHARRMVFTGHLKILRLATFTGCLIAGISMLGGFLVLVQKLSHRLRSQPKGGHRFS